MSIIYTIINEKGGVSKTTTALNLAVGLVQQDKTVLAIDVDPQADLTTSFGAGGNDRQPTIASILNAYIMDDSADVSTDTGIIELDCGVDLIPSSKELSKTAIALTSVSLGRESILHNHLDLFAFEYDYTIIDCPPSLGLLTINAMCAADKVIIPVEADYLSIKGLESMLHTIRTVQRSINPQIQIGGVLVAKLDPRTRYARIALDTIDRELKQNNIPVYNARIPRSISAVEASSRSVSIYDHDPNGTVAAAFRQFTQEVLDSERQQTRRRTEYER